MQDYKKQFIDFCITNQVIRFGEFTLKSGRISPYFFNAGLFNSGQTISRLGKFYAETIVNSGLEFDILFGPAYKGILLVVATAIALAENYGIDKPICFNRKLAKDHGEGGSLVGAPLTGKVLLIDDVITAGTAIKEIFPLLESNNAALAGICIALNRQEKGQGKLSAIQEIEQHYNAAVMSIINFDDLNKYIQNSTQFACYVEQMNHYRQNYGV